MSAARGPYELAKAEGVLFRALDAADCPLEAAEREQAKRNLTWGFIKRTLRDVRMGRLGLAAFRLRHSTLRVGDWIRYVRHPRRETNAGTPPAHVRQRAGTFTGGA